MTSLRESSDEARIRSELESFAQRWSEILSFAEQQVAQTEYRTGSAYAVLPIWFEASNLTPGARVASLPAKGGVRYGLDTQGRVQTGEHFEGSRATVHIAAWYEPEQRGWLRKTPQWGTFVELVRLEDGRPVEWYQTARNTLRLCRGIYTPEGRLVEILNQSIVSTATGKVSETRDRLEYDAAGTILRITRSGIGDDRVLYQSKASAAKQKDIQRAPGATAGATEGAAETIAPILEQFLKLHPDQEALAVVLAYDGEAVSPSTPLLGVIWRGDYDRKSGKNQALEALLNPAEYDSFDIPPLSLARAGIESMVPSIAAQRQFYVDLARALSDRLAESPRPQQAKPVVYATDLECRDLRQNLDELGIRSLGAA